MIIKDFQIEVFTPPCEPGAPRFAAKAHLRQDIRKVLPYMNAVLEGAEYNPAAPALRWKKSGHTIVFHPLEIATSNLTDRCDAEAQIHELVDMVNRIWDRRVNIIPSEEVRRRPSHLAVFKLLPGTNCKECGEHTCYNFALKIVTGKAVLGECSVLARTENQATRSQLAEMLTSM